MSTALHSHVLCVPRVLAFSLLWLMGQCRMCNNVRYKITDLDEFRVCAVKLEGNQKESRSIYLCIFSLGLLRKRWAKPRFSLSIMETLMQLHAVIFNAEVCCNFIVLLWEDRLMF